MSYMIIAILFALNIFLLWYVSKLLRKFLFVSNSLADLYFTAKAFQIFGMSLYSMDNYHGEPMIRELMLRIREVNEEIDKFRDIFEPMLDDELEEEFKNAEIELEDQDKLLLEEK